MMRFVLRRLVWAVFVLWIVVSAVFLLVHVVGDPALATLGEKAEAQQLAQFRSEHGLDRPLAERYGAYLKSLLTLELGRSYQDGRAVTDLIATRLPRTVLLGAMALGLELLLGIGLGVLAAVKRGTWTDTLATAVGLVGISAPTFVTGLLFLGYFAVRLNWFPVGGYGVGLWAHVWHAFLPALTLAITGIATYARLVRSELIETLDSDYVRTARAKGLGPFRVLFAHGLRNALVPVVTMLGVSLRVLVSGAIVTETIFAWPGMGRLAAESIGGLDLPVVMGLVFVASATVQLGNLLADVAVAALDPRVREA
jgi:peptide/nickel transport system permease protein